MKLVYKRSFMLWILFMGLTAWVILLKMIVKSLQSNFTITLNFNAIGEGISEVILIISLNIFFIIAIINYLKEMKNDSKR